MCYSISIGEILQQLSLPEAVTQALSTHHGALGELLRLVSTAESRDYAASVKQLANLPFNGDAYVDAQLQALNWAAKINPVA